MCKDCCKPVVLVTGFGPFSGLAVNASWEAVKRLNKDEIEEKLNIQLVQLEVPVQYEKVDEIVPALWKTFRPLLTIHVGQGSNDVGFCLETQAHRHGYQDPDCCSECPEDYTCRADGPFKLKSEFNVQRICEEFNNEMGPHRGMTSVVSDEAGKFLCEYIYYTSLSVDTARTLFVHVPDASVYPAHATARGIRCIVELCLRHLCEEPMSTSTKR